MNNNKNDINKLFTELDNYIFLYQYNNIDKVVDKIISINPYIFCYIINCGEIKTIDINEPNAQEAILLINKYINENNISYIIDSFKRNHTFDKVFSLNKIDYKVLFKIAYNNDEITKDVLINSLNSLYNLEEIDDSLNRLQTKDYLLIKNDKIVLTKMFEVFLKTIDETD